MEITNSCLKASKLEIGYPTAATSLQRSLCPIFGQHHEFSGGTQMMAVTATVRSKRVMQSSPCGASGTWTMAHSQVSRVHRATELVIPFQPRVAALFCSSALRALVSVGKVAGDLSNCFSSFSFSAGLTSAQFFKGHQPVACPDPTCGLVIRNRAGREIRVVIPPDCIAFQVGRAMSIHSGGRLQATPHCVRVRWITECVSGLN